MAENNAVTLENPKDSDSVPEKDIHQSASNSLTLHVPIIYGHYIFVNFGNVSKPVLIDTGATASMIGTEMLNHIGRQMINEVKTENVGQAKLVDGRQVGLLGTVFLNLFLEDRKFSLEFQVMPFMEYWAIIGMDFLQKHNCIIDYSKNEIVIPYFQTVDGIDIGDPSIGVCKIIPKDKNPSSEIEICEAPKEAHDMAYYQKAAIPTFSNYEDEQVDFVEKQIPKELQPVPLDLSNSIFTEEQKQQFRKLIKKYRSAFAVDDTELGRTHIYTHKLRLKPGSQPPRPKLYQTNSKDREIIKKHILDMLKNDIIKPVSEGVFSSPTLLVPKKDGGLRFCADLREMNKILEEDVYPLPLIRDVIDAIGTSQSIIYSIVDLRSAFWQINVHPQSQKYLTINTHMGRYAFKVLPFGLHSSPSAFQRLMNTVLRGVLWEFAIPFLDDVVIFSKNASQHLEHLEEVFQRLVDAGLKLKPQKCMFGVNHIKYLGHNIGRKGIAPFEEKVQAVKEFPTPTTMTQVKSFLGMANYYRKFIKDFSRLARPLNELTKKSKVFQWSEDCQNSFMELKRRLVSAPVLAHANPSLPFRLTTDASRSGLGWVLEQKQDGKYRVICYGGKSLTKAQSNYGISDLEALAVVTAVKDLDCYLRYQKFEILTDHQPLKYMLTNSSPPPGRWSRWIALLSPYKFSVEYLKGSANRVADTLSRRKYSATAPDEDDLESYLCSVKLDNTDSDQFDNTCNDPQTPLTERHTQILNSEPLVASNQTTRFSDLDGDLVNPKGEFSKLEETAISEVSGVKVNHNDDSQKSILEEPPMELETTLAAVQVKPKNPFRRTKNWVKYKAPKTQILVGRMDPALASADCIINFTTNQLKPIGPVSKSIQLTGGSDYKKKLQTSLNKNGPLNMGSIRKIEGGCTNSLWIYNVNLPRFKLGKTIAPNTVYKILQTALENAVKSKINKIILSPTDLISLDYSSTRAVELITQIIWDYCQSDKPQFSEILVPIQTLSMAEKTGKIFAKFEKEPKLKIFKYEETSTEKQPTARLDRPDKTIMDPQRLLQELNLSKGFTNLNYDLDIKEVQTMQLKDDYFGLIINYLKHDKLPESEKIAKKIRKESQNYELISGILYNFWIMPKGIPMERRARFRLCVPPELRHRLMYAYHDTPISAHRSAEKMYLLMKLNYFWKGMFQDLQNWTKSCVRCSKAKALPRNRRAKLQPIMESRALAHLNVDLIGPMEHCVEQYRYVLTMVDRATRYCFAVPIPDGSAVTIAKAIFSEVISKFGLVDCIVSDRGLNFTSPIVQHLCSLLGTKRILTSAYRPSSNGLVESFNGVFKQKLLALAGEHPHTWPKYIDGVLYALRTTVVDSIGYSPFELMFGREPKLLLEVGPDVLKTHPSKSVRKYLAELRTQISYLRDAAIETEEKQKQKMKEDYDNRSKPYKYQEGDRVWIRSPQTTPGSTRKFRDKFVGPYILGEQTSENTFKVRREDTNILSDVAIHSDRFKPCITRYAKPEYMPGLLIDETATGPELPISMCTEDDFINEENEKPKSQEETIKASESLVKAVEDLNKKVDHLIEDNDQLESSDSKSKSTETSEEYYPVDKIIRGKYTPDGIKYLIKWKGYSKKYNTWEKESDLSTETLESLKSKPVRIFGRKPTSPNLENNEEEDPDLSHNNENKTLKQLTEEEIQELYDADTDVDSDASES